MSIRPLSAVATTSADAAIEREIRGDTTTNNEEDVITVGRLVEVASRTWPGINKPGGVAKVTRRYEQEAFVDVSYIVGSSKEKRVPLEYVTLAPQYEVTTHQPVLIQSCGLRDRTLIMGRCRRCGSLRTDCGSCDWATEEAAEAGRQQQHQQQQQQQSSSRGRKPPAINDTTHLTLSDDSSSSSQDDDEDDVVLTELFRTSRKNFRNHLQQRRRFADSFGAVGEPTPSTTKEKAQQKEEEHNEHSKDSDEDDMEELLQQSQRQFRRHVRKRNQWQRRIDAISQKSDRRGRVNQRSVLETLGATDYPAGTRVYGTKKQDTTILDPKRRVTLDIGLEAKNQEDDLSSPLPKSTPSRPHYEHYPIDVNESSVIEEAMVSPGSLAQDCGPMPFVNDDNYDESSNRVQDLQRRASSYLNDPDENGSHNDPDDIFIQPEGNDAAENLPSDMVDHTKDLAFIELPSFFNHTADVLENDLLPDYALRIAKLEREQRRLISPRAVPQSTISATNLLNDCSTLYNEMQRTLIREGIDQCSLALKKLSDDKLFRTVRKQLSPQQRKKIRSSAMMDARNLRLDALEESVKDLVRKLRSLAETLEDLNEDADAEDDAYLMAFDGESSDEVHSDTEFETPRSSEGPMNDHQVVALDPCERELGPFDPHQHASRVRTNKRPNASARRQSTESKGERVPKRTKRTREGGTSSMHDFITDDVARISRAKSRSSHSTQTSLNDGSSDAGQHRTFPPGPDQPNHPVDSETSDDGEEEDSRASDLFIDESHKESAPSSAYTSGHDVVDVGRRRRRTTSHNTSSHVMDSVADPPRETQPCPADRVPISRRMQDFLDKNQENDFGDDDKDTDDRVTVPSSRQDITGRRSQRREVSDLRGMRHTVRIDSETSGGSREHSSGIPAATVKEADTIVTRDYLLSRWDANSGEMHPTAPSAILVDVPFVSLVDQLRLTYPRDPSGASQLLQRVQSAIQQDRNQSHIETIRRISSELMTEHGRATLSELIFGETSRLGAHVQLLSTLVTSLADTVFGGRRDHFLSILVLQLVDAVYALMHPSGWAVKGLDRVGTLQLLEPLRDVLASTISLNEEVCRCVVQHLGCQEWKIGECRNYIYLSGFEPCSWTRFVESGDYTMPSPHESRFLKLGKIWPRVEIETTWNVLLFLGSAQQEVDQAKQARWQLVTKLFSSSVLAKTSEEDTALPPNAALLKAFELDIDSFGHLIRKGALDHLPTTDMLLFNLFKRAVTVQAEDYHGNEESRFRSFPTFGPHRKAKRLLSRLWNTTQSLLNSDFVESRSEFYHVHQVFFHSSSPVAFGQVKNLLLPTSRLLGACLSLVVAWAGRVPQKKVRQVRFLKSLKALRESLSTVEKHIGAGVSSTNDPFANAFEESRPTEIGTAGERVSVFVAETNCYLLILESICSTSEPSGTPSTHMMPQNSGLPQATMTYMWKEVSCDRLEHVRQSLLKGSSDEHSGPFDPMKVFVAGKIMLTATFLCLGISPWHLSFSEATKLRLFIDTDKHKAAIDYYAYPISCVVACVAALSEQCHDTAPLCHILTVVTILFNHLTGVVRSDGASTTLNRVGAQVEFCYLPVLTRCLRRHISSEKDNNAGRYLYRVILSAIRALATFQTIRLMKETAANDPSRRAFGTTTNTPMTTNSNRDYCFDDLDDSFFASLETGGQTIEVSGPSIAAANHWSWILTVLDSLADLSIRPNIVEGGEIYISTTAKYVLRQEIDRICDCLVALALAQKAEKSKELWRNLISWIQQSQRQNMDTDIQTKISKRLSIQICLMTCTHEACRSIVAENLELFLCGIIRALLDCNRLEAFPSCSFALLMDAEGEGAMRQALVDIQIFNGNLSARPTNMSPRELEKILESQRKRKEKIQQPWVIIEILGIAFKESPLSVVGFLHHPDHDLLSTLDDSIDSACLEKESFSCFVFLRNVITAVSKQETEISLYESISGNILALLALEMLRVFHGLKYFDLTNQGLAGQGESSPNRGKIVSLLHCTSELFFAAAAWILRGSRSDASSGWKAVTTQLCDRIFHPLLRRRRFDITSNLGLLIETCRSVIPRPMLSGSVPNTGTTCCSKYFDHCYDVVIRRSRQLVSGPVLTSVLLSYMIEGVNESEPDMEIPLSELIGKSFLAASQVSVTLPRGPLGEEIDDYLSVVESSLAPTDDPDRMANKRLDALRHVIIPKLLQKKTDLNTKRRVLRVASYMFTEPNALSGSSTNDTEELLQLVTSFARVILQTLFQCLSTYCVDNELLSVAFACAGNLAKVDMAESFEDPKALLCFCDDEVVQIDFSDLSILTDAELRALYLHTFFRWMFQLSGKLCRTATPSADILSALRQLCAEEKRLEPTDDCVLRALSESREMGGTDDDLEVWTKVIASLEDKLFGSKSENRHPVVNVYAKTSSAVDTTAGEKGNGRLGPWKPPGHLTRSAMEFMTTIVSHSS